MSLHGGSPNGHAHEKTDALTRPIFRFAAGMAVFIAVAMVITAILFSYFTKRANQIDALQSPLARQAPPPVLVGPKLQPDPPVDLKKLLHDEDAHLNSFGWVDQREGLVHIPIDEAIELMAKRGLPVRGNAAAPEQKP